MANLYDVTNHPLLSDNVKELGSTALEAHARVAETLLGLTTFTAFTAGSPEYERAQDAVAMQVNYQVEAGIDAFVLGSLTKGGRSMSFRGGRRMPPIHSVSRKIVSAIKPRATVTGR